MTTSSCAPFKEVSHCSSLLEIHEWQFCLSLIWHSVCLKPSFLSKSTCWIKAALAVITPTKIRTASMLTISCRAYLYVRRSASSLPIGGFNLRQWSRHSESLMSKFKFLSNTFYYACACNVLFLIFISSTPTLWPQSTPFSFFFHF